MFELGGKILHLTANHLSQSEGTLFCSRLSGSSLSKLPSVPGSSLHSESQITVIPCGGRFKQVMFTEYLNSLTCSVQEKEIA